MGKLSKAFAAASLSTLASCTSMPVPKGEPGHRPRAMTCGEIAMAQEIFGNQIDYSAVSVYSHHGPRSKGLHGRIQMSSSIYADDYSKVRDLHMKGVFIHELAHIWQEQRGVDIVGSAIGEWFRHGGQYNRAYAYTLSATINFNALGIEQQAAMIEDYWRAVHAPNAARQCSVIAQFERALKPVLPAIQTPAACR